MQTPPDIYKEDVDFTALALQYPDFAKRLKQNRQLDFSDPESVRQLTKALLHRDFNLSIDLPEDRLCPPVPNRLNYVLFVEQLLKTSRDVFDDQDDPDRRIVGLDIGTGASAIYPLLACRRNIGWLFFGTEIDAKSRNYAKRNVDANNLNNRIKILDAEQIDQTGQQLIPVFRLDDKVIDILMTNPPFYSSSAEMLSLAKQKSRPPNSACTGSESEMITPGGEVAFVSKLVQESMDRHVEMRVRWFSSMLGKLGSVSVIIEKLLEVGCTNYAVTEFVQGHQTRRWCIAWSWRDLRPSLEVSRGTDAVEKKLLPLPPKYTFPVDSTEVSQVALKINEQLKQLEKPIDWRYMDWRWQADKATGVGRSNAGDLWSRRARRKYLQKTENEDAMDIENDSDNDEKTREKPDWFAFRITLEKSASLSGTTVTIRWLQGLDSRIFESFCGWLKRKFNK